MQAAAEIHDTPSSASGWELTGLGLGTTDQLVPFHDSTSVPPPPLRKPTAVQAVTDTHDTP